VLADVCCSNKILAQISAAVCEAGVGSLRADLAAVRASIAYAALAGDAAVLPSHVATVLPLVLAHRSYDKARSPAQRPQPPAPPSSSSEVDGGEDAMDASDGLACIFAPKEVKTFAVRANFDEAATRGASAPVSTFEPGAVVRSRRSESPVELDLRATLHHAVMETGRAQPRVEDLHERVRKPSSGMRYLFVIDSSGSHAAQERMRLVKGAASGLLTRSFRNGDEVAIIVFRGTSAQVVLEPTRTLQEAVAAFEYLPTGGRTPLAHALDLARRYLTAATVLILLTDGRANVAVGAGDPWQEALEIASEIKTPALVIDTESSSERLGRPRKLAEVLAAEYVCLENLDVQEEIVLALQRLPMEARRS
jgi:magnesium chelatase subunit D